MSQGFTQGLSIPLSVANGGTGSSTGSLASMNNLPYAGIASSAWTAFTPTLTGFSSTTANIGRYVLLGKICIVNLYINGTSNATSFSLSNLPATSANNGITMTMLCYAVDNATGVVGLAQITPSSSTLTFYNGISAGAWTSSGNKVAVITFAYETA
jgi:hypothetical protein